MSVVNSGRAARGRVGESAGVVGSVPPNKVADVIRGRTAEVIRSFFGRPRASDDG